MDLLKLISDLNDAVAKLSQKPGDSMTKEQIEKMMDDVLKKRDEEDVKRKSQFNVDSDDDDGKGISSIHKRILAPSKSDVDRELQTFNDQLYLTSTILKAHPHSLAMWREFNKGSSDLRKALDTSTANRGTDWIPTNFSAQFTDLVQLQLKVANLFQTIPMPSNPYKLPVVNADGTGYLQTESTADDAVKLRASQPGTTNTSFSAKKLAARYVFSEEVNEDSIVPIFPWLQQNIVKSVAIAEEKAIINGDTASTHQDSNVTNSYDAQKAWNGLRKLTASGAKVDISTFNLDNLNSVRKEMGVYGVNPADMAYIVGISGYIQLLNIRDSNGNQVVTTVDKYGPNAVILSGELAKFAGSPVIVSEYVYENLNASGVYDGVTTTKTVIICVHRPSFAIGDRRRITVKSAVDIETDQQILVCTERKDFQPFYASTNTMIGLGYNLAS